MWSGEVQREEGPHTGTGDLIPSRAFPGCETACATGAWANRREPMPAPTITAGRTTPPPAFTAGGQHRLRPSPRADDTGHGRIGRRFGSRLVYGHGHPRFAPGRILMGDDRRGGRSADRTVDLAAPCHRPRDGYRTSYRSVFRQPHAFSNLPFNEKNSRLANVRCDFAQRKASRLGIRTEVRGFLPGSLAEVDSPVVNSRNLLPPFTGTLTTIMATGLMDRVRCYRDRLYHFSQRFFPHWPISAIKTIRYRRATPTPPRRSALAQCR